MVYESFSAAVGWDKGIPESKNTILLMDTLKSDSTFLLLQILAESLKGSDKNTKERASYSKESCDKCILVSFSQVYQHYSRILRKMNLKTDELREQGKLVFIDGFTEYLNPYNSSESPAKKDTEKKVNPQPEVLLRSSQEQTPMDAVKYVAEAILDALHEVKNNHRVGIFIDGLSTLIDMGWTGKTVRLFMDTLKSIAEQLNGFLVVQITSDPEIVDHLEPNDEYIDAIVGLQYRSGLILKVEPLVSGYSSKVSGQITISNKSYRLGNVLGSSILHYKLYENRVDFFPPGQHKRIL